MIRARFSPLEMQFVLSLSKNMSMVSLEFK